MLPFQKSWFRFKDINSLYDENIRFFCKAENESDVIHYFGNRKDIFKSCAYNNGEIVTDSLSDDSSVQFAVFDLLDTINGCKDVESYERLKNEIINEIKRLYNRILHRRFVAVLVQNIEIDGHFFPFAWDLAKSIGTMLSLKDEKIGCVQDPEQSVARNYFTTDKSTFYALYFRKDENSDGIYREQKNGFFENISQTKNPNFFSEPIKNWFILKPQPRKRDEILHPAKYPEDLVDIFVKQFTRTGDNVFDPMSGTGSTQLGALKCGRNGYGAELSLFFTEIAAERCEIYTASMEHPPVFDILHLDARMATQEMFPMMDYILTSPPYWDMLNMKGAENQAARREKGLLTNYSDSDKDLGNIADYELFVNELLDVYDNVIELLKPGGYMTIIVKNIKKKGKNYPFAWDLAEKLQKKLSLLPVTFWCQDDLSIAPYGYGNTWVSNTFHHYCLSFRKPL